MRICRIVNKFRVGDQILGDLEPNFYYLSKYAADAGFDVHVISGREDSQPKFQEIDGIKIHRVARISRYRDLLIGEFARACLAKIRHLDPDIIHGHMDFHFGCILNRSKLRAKIITHYHAILDSHKYADFLPFSYNPIKALWDRIMARYYFYNGKFVLSRSDYVIAVSKACELHIKQYLPEARIQTIYNGVDPGIFHRVETDLKQRLGAEHLILYVGRPSPWKGIQYLLAALDKLREFHGLKLVLLGAKRGDPYDFYLNWIKHLISKWNLGNRVMLLDRVPYVQMPEYYSAADCLVVPSFPDASPKVVYEALACGTPIIGVNGGGIPELVAGTINQELLVRPKDPDQIAQKIRYVLQNGVKPQPKMFAWEDSARAVIQLYQQMCEHT